jgi:hypothetical protein
LRACGHTDADAKTETDRADGSDCRTHDAA